MPPNFLGFGVFTAARVKTLFFFFLLSPSFGVLIISANLAVSNHKLHGILDCF